MGINLLWQEDFFVTVRDSAHHIAKLETDSFTIIDLGNHIFIHLLPLSNQFLPDQLTALQNEYQLKGKQIIHLWEDVWLAKRQQVLNRIQSFVGENKRVHGRKTKIVELSNRFAKQFLSENHLQGFVNCKTYLGLTLHGDLIAVAGFSATRPMKSKGANYQSVELVRFASLGGFTIIGGLSKLINHFLTTVQVDDLMTYADRDWSIGKGYEKLGFQQTTITAPSYLYVNTTTWQRYFPHRLPKSVIEAFEQQNSLNLDDFLISNNFAKVFNTGNLKYHLYL